MSSEHRNRTNKAQAIAAALWAAGITDYYQVGRLSEAAWKIAAVAGWHVAAAEQVEGIAKQPWTTVSLATREQVAELVKGQAAKGAEDAEGLTAHRTDDVFASIAAGSALPRPVQDPDAAIPSSVGVRQCGASHIGTGDWRTCPSPACVEQRERDAAAGIDLWPSAPVVSTREWLSARNYGALATEPWD